MKLETTMSHVGSTTTTSATRTWSSWVMYKSAHNETPNVRAYHRSFHITCPLSNEGIHDVSNAIMCGYPLTSKQATN
jgi:hypothetical protein